MSNVLETSLDWQKIRAKLQLSAQDNIPEFRGDIQRLLHNLDEQVSALSSLEVEVRARRLRPKNLIEHVEKINKDIKAFQKYYMVALMFKS